MGTTGLKEKIVLFRELFFGRFSLALRVLLAHSAVKCFLESSTWNDMDKLVIRGGTPLLGTVRISGAKNAALPCMAAALLTEDTVILENIPQVRDIETTRRLLSAMGAEVELGYGRAHHRTTIQTRNLAAPEAPKLSSTKSPSPAPKTSSWPPPLQRAKPSCRIAPANLRSPTSPTS